MIRKNFSKTVAAITAASLVAVTPLSAFAVEIKGGGEEKQTYTYTSEDVSNDKSESGVDIKEGSGTNQYNRPSANAKVEVKGDINITDKDADVTKTDKVYGVSTDSKNRDVTGEASVTVDGNINVDITNTTESTNKAYGISTKNKITSDINVTGNIDVKSNTSAYGIAANEDNSIYVADKKDDIIVGGNINVEAKETATGIGASSSQKNGTNITIEKGITTTSSGSSTGVFVSDNATKSNSINYTTDIKTEKFQAQTNIEVNGNITSETRTETGTGIGISASDVVGNISITVDGDVKGTTNAIVVSDIIGNVDIVSTGTISSGDAAIVVNTSKNKDIINKSYTNKDNYREAYDAEALPNITVWKIESDNNELVKTTETTYMYEKDENGYIKTDDRWQAIKTEEPQVKENGSLKDKVLSSINYIIKGSVLEDGKDTQNGKIVLMGASGSVTVGDQTYDTAHQDENLTINVETVSGYKYSLSDSQGLLVKNADGSYTLKVPAGGGVDLKAVLEKIEEQTDTDTDTDKDNTDKDNTDKDNTDKDNTDNDKVIIVSSRNGRNSESSHIVGSSSVIKAGSTSSSRPETPGNWAKDADNNWIYVNNGRSYNNIWIYVNDKWYYLNNNGNPVTDWQTVLDKHYFFSTEDTSEHPYGSLYVSELTPDSVYVDSNGSRLS